MSALSDRIVNLSESATLQMAALARKLKSEGKNVITLSLGEPDFNTPDYIGDAAKKAIDEGYTHYTPVNGYQELREAISEKFKRENGLDYSPAQIVVSTGAKQSIANAVLSLVNPGEEVLLPAPYWVSYAAQVELAEGIIKEIPSGFESNFKISPQQLDEAITEKTKLIIFSSPCNPSGSVYTKEELKTLAEVIVKYDNLYVITDEIYEHIVYEGQHESLAQFDFVKDRVITVNGLSKGFAMTGWRLGYLAAPLNIAKACTKMQGQFTSGTCSITQRAAITALNGNLGPTHKMKTEFLRRRNIILGLLNDIPGFKTQIPQGAFYVFPDVTYYFGKHYKDMHIDNADDLCMYLLNYAHVSLVTGSAFGNPDCVRISYAASEEDIREAMARTKEWLGKLENVN